MLISTAATLPTCGMPALLILPEGNRPARVIAAASDGSVCVVEETVTIAQPRRGRFRCHVHGQMWLARRRPDGSYRVAETGATGAMVVIGGLEEER